VVVIGLEAEGEPPKRYTVTYGGDRVANGDTAREAWDGYRRYEDNIRSVTEKAKRSKYEFFDGQTKLSVEAFWNAVGAEQAKP
jgi:hypothetical protein